MHATSYRSSPPQHLFLFFPALHSGANGENVCLRACSWAEVKHGNSGRNVSCVITCTESCWLSYETH